MQDTKITLTHLNIRQSIVILLFKLITLDILVGIVIAGFYFVLIQGEVYLQFAVKNAWLFLAAMGITGLIKVIISIYVVLLWLNEYYEITPDSVIHKKGIIVKKTEKYNLEKIRALKIQDTFLGEMCNFATLSLYDVRLNKYLDLYLIHNPDRYAKILQTLKPDLEFKKDRIVLPLVTRKEEFEDVDE